MLVVLAVVMIFAVVFLFMQALNRPSPPQMTWGWMGLALWALVVTIGMFASSDLRFTIG